jgi:cytoplasmic tRNA 2-thiolation protein 2
MCSVAEDDFGDEGGVHTMLKDIALNTIEEENCKKCSVEKCVIKLDFKEAMCLSCFLYYVRHKFKATLGSSKILKRQSNVIFQFKGTNADVCLLHMIKFAFEEDTYKKLLFDIKLAFVDESCTEDGDTLKIRIAKIQEIKNILDQFPSFTCCYSTIANSLKIFEDISTISCSDLEDIIKSEEEFLSAYNSIDTKTSKQDFLEIMRKNAIRDIAHHLNCSYIFLSDISVDFAKKLISNIALGRGSSVASDVSFCDDRIDCVKIIKPLKDLNQIEVDNYVKFNKLKSCSLSSDPSLNDNLASIQNLTSNFINQLQQNCYNSTVSTVYKCCNKIAPINETSTSQDDLIPSKFARSYITNMNQRCLLCKSILDYNHSETLYAIEFSRCVSSQIASNIEGMESIQKIREASANAKNGNDRSKFLCHGCRNIFSGMNEETLTNIF